MTFVWASTRMDKVLAARGLTSSFLPGASNSSHAPADLFCFNPADDPIQWDWLRMYPPLIALYQRPGGLFTYALRDLLGEWLHQNPPLKPIHEAHLYLLRVTEHMHQQNKMLPRSLQQRHEDISGWQSQMTRGAPQVYHILQQIWQHERHLWQEADFFSVQQDGTLPAERIPLLHPVGHHQELVARLQITRPLQWSH